MYKKERVINIYIYINTDKGNQTIDNVLTVDQSKHYKLVSHVFQIY